MRYYSISRSEKSRPFIHADIRQDIAAMFSCIKNTPIMVIAVSLRIRRGLQIRYILHRVSSRTRIYLLHLHLEIRAVWDFVLACELVRFKCALYAVSVRQTEVLPAETLFSLYIRLPSDSTSRWTPLSLANSSYCQVCSGLSPPSCNACRAH